MTRFRSYFLDMRRERGHIKGCFNCGVEGNMAFTCEKKPFCRDCKVESHGTGHYRCPTLQKFINDKRQKAPLNEGISKTPSAMRKSETSPSAPVQSAEDQSPKKQVHKKKKKGQPSKIHLEDDGVTRSATED